MAKTRYNVCACHTLFFFKNLLKSILLNPIMAIAKLIKWILIRTIGFTLSTPYEAAFIRLIAFLSATSARLTSTPSLLEIYCSALSFAC